jgi:hypothetical protein
VALLDALRDRLPVQATCGWRRLVIKFVLIPIRALRRSILVRAQRLRHDFAAKVEVPLAGALRARLPVSTTRISRNAAEAVSAAFPGIAVAVALALAAGWIAGGLGDPLARNPVLVAMLFGLLIGNIFAFPDTLRPGLDFTKR